MERADGGAVEPQQPASLEHAVDDRLGEVVVVEHAAPRLERLVRCKDHRAVPPMSLVDDMEEHIGGVGAVREIADFIDHQDRGMRVRRQRVRELARAKRGREVIDECGGGRKEGIEAVLDGAVRDRDCQVGFSAARFAREDDRASLSDKVR